MTKLLKPLKPRATIASTARKMVLAGKSNKQIWAALKLIYKLDDAKKHYPAWFRAEVARKAAKTQAGQDVVGA